MHSLRKVRAETTQQIAVPHGIPWVARKRQPPSVTFYSKVVSSTLQWNCLDELHMPAHVRHEWSNNLPQEWLETHRHCTELLWNPEVSFLRQLPDCLGTIGKLQLPSHKLLGCAHLGIRVQVLSSAARGHFYGVITKGASGLPNKIFLKVGKVVLESWVSAILIQSGSTGPHSQCWVNCSMHPMQFWCLLVALAQLISIAVFVLSGIEEVSDTNSLSHHVILSPRIDAGFQADVRLLIHSALACLHSIHLVNWFLVPCHDVWFQGPSMLL